MRNALTIKAFTDWVEQQPADMEYIWTSCWFCAVGRYAQTIGIDFEEIYTEKVIYGTGFWREADELAQEKPHTFGALANRLREKMAT